MAMNERTMRYLIGVFVLAGGLLLAWLILLFGNARGVLPGGQDRYYVTFDYAAGVTPGTPVVRSGVRIGQVESVNLDDATGKVRVALLIDRPHKVFTDDRVVIRHGALSGDTSIEFVGPSAEQRPVAPRPQSGAAPEVVPAAFLAQVPPAKPGGAAPPPPGRVPATPGTEFKGASQADIAALLQELAGLTPPARDAFTEMARTLERYEKLTPLVEETLREYRDLARAAQPAVTEYRELAKETRQLAKVARETVPELRRTNDEIQVTARNWGRLGERLDVLVQTNQDQLVKALENFNTALVRIANVVNEENQRNLAATLRNTSAGTRNLETISRNAEEVSRNLQQATRPMAERAPATMKNLDEGAAKFNQSFTNLSATLGAFNRPDGTLQRLLADPSLYNNLNEAACMLTHILPRLDYILKDVGVFADKIARHPESLGIGGAVRPSSGLKEAPSSTSFRPYFPDH
jgi:ABC-type transporter Mla subunit MlaD